MNKLNLKSILKDNLRQIKKEKAYYASTQNQVMFFELLNDELKIEKQIKELK